MISKNLGERLRSGHYSRRGSDEIGLITDSVGHLPFERRWTSPKEQGLSSVEVATGNWSEAPHADLPALVSSAVRPGRVRGKIAVARADAQRAVRQR